MMCFLKMIKNQNFQLNGYSGIKNKLLQGIKMSWNINIDMKLKAAERCSLQPLKYSECSSSLGYDTMLNRVSDMV